MKHQLMTTLYNECTRITTLRLGQYIDITVDADGSVAETIGPFSSHELALRWERWLVLRAASVVKTLAGPRDELSGFAWQMHIEHADAENACLPVYHQHWMDA